MLIEPDALVLFQGDSITDCGRGFDTLDAMGNGYAMMVAAWLAALRPDTAPRFINRGVSGNCARDLRARWQRDCLDLQPAWVSILIGINDVWRRYDDDEPTSLEDFEADYRAILEQTRAAGIRPILCEPFVLPVPPDRARWREDLDPKIDAVRRLAREFAAPLVPLDGAFAQASTRRPPDFWAPDGVHPTAVGHALIAQTWLRTVGAPILG
ncbi:MAG TPA: SGNH/GDSL hydrolase family protein [Ktedonobacterales bacterium]|jgi:lysophospholipase L1-like esterase